MNFSRQFQVHYVYLAGDGTMYVAIFSIALD